MVANKDNTNSIIFIWFTFNKFIFNIPFNLFAGRNIGFVSILAADYINIIDGIDLSGCGFVALCAFAD